MTSVSVYVAGSKDRIINSATVTRSITDFNSTADISLPLNIIAALESDDEVAIEVDGVVLFHGIAGDYTLSYSGGNASVSVPCVDLSYKLTHMLAVEPGGVTLISGTAVSGNAIAIQLAATASASNDEYNGLMIEITGGTGSGQTRKIYDYTGATNFAAVTPAWTTAPSSDSTYRLFRGFAEGTDIGQIIYDLLADTGIDRSHINKTTGVLLTDAYEVGTGIMRAEVISELTKKYNSLFYLSYGKIGSTYATYGEFDTYTGMEASGEFLEEHTLTDANNPIFELSVARSIESDITRVIVYRDIAGVLEVGVATLGSAPYIDKVIDTGTPDTVRTGTALGGTLVSIQLETTAPAVDGTYVGCVVAITGGTGSGQVRKIYQYTGATRFAAVTPAFSVAPSSDSTYTIYTGFLSVDDIAEEYLDNIRLGINKLDLSFQNLAVSLFNIVDLSAVCSILGITNITRFRVTDLDYTITAGGITTKTTGVDPDVQLWDRTVQNQVGTQTVGKIVEEEAVYQTERGKPVYATVVE